jgi:uncharacterized protein (DUF1697 family)
MTKFVALLRGINVGGGNKILMPELKAALSKRGLQQVTTYIQSGNLVFCSDMKTESAVAELIGQCILEYFKLSIPCVCLVETKYKAVVKEADRTVYPDFDSKKAYFTFFDSKIESNIEHDSAIFSPDLFQLNGNCAYVYVPTRAGKTKLTNLYLEKLTGKVSSTRNYRTVYKLVEMLNYLEA